MRRGFTLVEVLVVMAILPFAAMALNGLFYAVIKEIPQSCRLVEENSILLNMLEQMYRDVSIAGGLPESFGSYTTGDKTLLVEQADCVVCYQLAEKSVIRREISQAGQEDADKATDWSLPNSQIQWHVRRENNRGVAVEVATHINYKLRTRYQKRMANARLYFVGCL